MLGLASGWERACCWRAPVRFMAIRVHPQPESYRGYVNLIGIRSCYDEGKRIAETLVSTTSA